MSPTSRRLRGKALSAVLAGLAILWGWGEPPRVAATIGGASPFPTEAIRGTIRYEGPLSGRIIVEAHARADFEDQPSASAVLARPGEYELKISSGIYYLRAFVDVNGTGTFDPGDPVGQYGASKAVVLLPLASKIGVDIEIRKEKP